MEQGPVEQVILEQCRRTRRAVPDRIRDAPELELGLELFYWAFWELTSSRTIGMSEGSIPWTVLSEYAVVNELHGEQRDDFLFHLRSLDDSYLKYRAENKPKA